MFQRKKFDFILVLPVFFLLVLSVAAITSVFPDNIKSHLIYIFISIGFFLFFSYFDLEILTPFSPLIFLANIFLLILVFVLGQVTRGSVRWIYIGGFTIQPSELIKISFALISSWFWTKNRFSYKNLVIYGLIFLPAFILIFLQPDLGSSLVIGSIFAGTLFFSGMKIKNFIILCLVGLLIIPLSWFFLKDYQKTRAYHFINPYSDPLGEGYNVIQSKITVGSGGIFGRGFGKGTQSHLFFLPERHTDFIFASAAEEFGFAGVALILGMYLLLFFRMLNISKNTQDRQSFLLCTGIFFYLSFQTVVNIGMNIGLMPITGVTLPFLSYGGSSLLTNMIGLGILENVSRKNRAEGTILIK